MPPRRQRRAGRSGHSGHAPLRFGRPV